MVSTYNRLVRRWKQLQFFWSLVVVVQVKENKMMVGEEPGALYPDGISNLVIMSHKHP